MIRTTRTNNYNWNFCTVTGTFMRWGKTFKDDPDWSPLGPEILDIEVTTSCKGPGGKPCEFCYKSNTPHGKNMSFKTFKKILDKMPANLTQIAFGADAQCESNPDIWKMMSYAREKDIIPNITVVDVSDDTATLLSSICGAVAVSRYNDKNICYNSIRKLTDRGLKQVNIHIMVSQETEDLVMETLKDYLEGEPRLEHLNAIVLLSLKQKGRGTGYTPLPQDRFTKIVKYSLDNKIPIGFDSCSAAKFLNSIKGCDNERQMTMCTESCESFGMFSSYINVNGDYFPCSFCEGSHPDFMDGPNVAKCHDFIKDIWNSETIKKWREIMLKRKIYGNFNCPIFEV